MWSLIKTLYSEDGEYKIEIFEHYNGLYHTADIYYHDDSAGVGGWILDSISNDELALPDVKGIDVCLKQAMSVKGITNTVDRHSNVDRVRT